MKYMVAIAHFLSEKEIFSPLFWKVKPFFSYHSEARKAKDHEFDMPVASDALATIIGRTMYLARPWSVRGTHFSHINLTSTARCCLAEISEHMQLQIFKQFWINFRLIRPTCRSLAHSCWFVNMGGKFNVPAANSSLIPTLSHIFFLQFDVTSGRSDTFSFQPV